MLEDKIRLMQKEDIEETVEMIVLSRHHENEEGNRDDTRAFFRQALNNFFLNSDYVQNDGKDRVVKNYNFYVMENKDQIIGCVGLQKIQYVGKDIDYYGHERFELRHLFIHPDYKDRNKGTRLVDLIIEEAREKGATKLYIQASPNSIGFYKKQNFYHVPSIPWDDQINPVMRRDLQNP